MSVLVHLSVGCAIHRIEGKARLGSCIAAAFVPDIIALPFMITGINGTNISHSLGMAAIWSLLFCAAMTVRYRNQRVAVLLLLASVSHWFVDLAAWPMTTIMPAAEYIPIFFETNSTLGFGLYRTLPGTIIPEALALAASIVLIMKKRPPKRASTLP